MRKAFNYENIAKYDLISFILEEYKKGHFTYMIILLDPSTPILDNNEKPYENGCIKEFTTWLQPMNNEGENRTTLFKQVERMLKTCEKFGYEIFIVYVNPYKCIDLKSGVGYPTLKFVTDEIIKVVEEGYKPLKYEFEGLPFDIKFKEK